MGRLSKQHKFLTSKVLDFLLEPENIQKNLHVSLTVLESYRKTRNSQRKKRFKTELTNVIKHLCIGSYRFEEAKKEVRGLEDRLVATTRHVQDWRNKCIRLEMNINDSLEYRKLYLDQKKTNRNAERDYGTLFRENEKLKERIARLQEQNEALKEKLAETKNRGE